MYWITLLLAVFFAAILMITNRQYAYTLQLNGYELGFSEKDKYFIQKTTYFYILLSILILIVNFVSLMVNAYYLVYIYWAVFISTAFYIRLKINPYQGKKKFVVTNRIKRLYCMEFAVISIIYYIVFIILSQISFDVTFLTLFVPIVALIMPICFLFSARLVEPIELHIKEKYISECKKKLQTTKATKIAITGSYGKTSVKNFLNTILKCNFKTLPTPESYNTPMGICKTVHDLKEDTEIFIAEMGARHVGDIDELMEIVDASIGILTGITNQHIESFLSLENIINEKKKIVTKIKEGGYCIINVDCPYCKKIYDDFTGNKVGVSIRGVSDIYADNIEISEDGSSFDLHIQKEIYHLKTKILGKHNILNIALAAAVALKLNMSAKDIAEGIKNITPVKHRLELMKNNIGITIIDDTFNSNFIGFESALEVLEMFEGRRIVVTPGIVELGEFHYDTNFKIGEKLSKVCSIVILIGEKITEPIYNALLKNNFDKRNVIVKKSLEEAKSEFKKIFKSGDVVLLENDLPDNYDEI